VPSLIVGQHVQLDDFEARGEPVVGRRLAGIS
jgi:hypothetical protein